MAHPPLAYHLLQYEQIRVAHVPASAPVPTPVILITLYRPGKHNAFTETMRAELVDLFDILSADPRVKAIVVTGHGNMFCAGMDLNGGRASIDIPTRDYRDGGGRLTLAIHRCTKPVIAAINGSAVGIGITMTLPMTIRVVSKDAKVGFVFARRGLVMEAASSYFLPRLIGTSKALHLVTTGSVYPSTSPLLSDLFTEIVDTREVVPRALGLAEEISRNTSTVCTQMMKDMIYHGPGSAEEAHLLDSKIIHELFQGQEHREGVASFLQKRPAKFEGSLPHDAPSSWPWWSPIKTETLDQLEKSKL